MANRRAVIIAVTALLSTARSAAQAAPPAAAPLTPAMTTLDAEYARAASPAVRDWVRAQAATEVERRIFDERALDSTIRAHFARPAALLSDRDVRSVAAFVLLRATDDLDAELSVIDREIAMLDAEHDAMHEQLAGLHRMQARVESEVAATTARKGTETCVSPECLAIPGQMAALRELFARAPHPFSVTMLTPIGYGGLRELQEQLRNVERGIVAPRENAERRRLALRARRAECVRAVARIMSAGVAPGGAAVMDSLVLR